MQPFYLTVSSVLTTSISTSIIAFLLCTLFRSHKVAERLGANYMLTLLLAVIIRTFLPLEFWYTRAIFIEDIFTDFRRAMEYPVWNFGSWKFCIKHCLLVVWGLGIVATLCCSYFSYRKCKRILLLLPKVSWDELFKKYQLQKEDYAGTDRVRIVFGNRLESPYIFGVKIPYLVLPDMAYTRQQMHYILLHELMHVRKKDIVWKISIGILCIGFWWNPAFWYLRRESNELLEIRNDKYLADGLSREEKGCYMECLVKMTEQFVRARGISGLTFNSGDLRVLIRRIQMLAGHGKEHRFHQSVITAAVAALLLFSTTFVLEVTSSLERIKKDTGIEDLEGAEPVSRGNTFVVENGERFDVYVDGEYLYTTDDISVFTNHIELYKTLEEAEERWKNEKDE